MKKPYTGSRLLPEKERDDFSVLPHKLYIMSGQISASAPKIICKNMAKIWQKYGKNMAKQLFLIFNHNFTIEQKSDAKKTLGVKNIIKMPSEAAKIWGNIPPDYPEIESFLTPVKNWLLKTARKNDFILIQGDFGACYILVKFSFKNKFIPIYSTTYREAVEQVQPDGTIKLTHRFRHKRFRFYGV